MQDRAERAARLDKMIADLSDTPRGSAEIDAMMAYGLGTVGGDCRRAVDLLARQGFAWSVISNLWDAETPAYSRSLDAAVPGEDVIATVYAPERKRWAAVQRTSAGENVVGWGATEVLARRIAALKALRATEHLVIGHPAIEAQAGDDDAQRQRSVIRPLTMVFDAARDRADGATAPAPEHKDEDAQPVDAGDWKILF